MAIGSGRGARRARVIVLGTGSRAQAVARALESRRGVQVLGFMDDEPEPRAREALGERYLGPVERLSTLARTEEISDVLFALPRQYLARDSTANALATCEMLGVDFTIAVDFFDTRHARVIEADIPGFPAFTLSVRHHQASWKLAIKRGIDMACAALGIAVCLPLWTAAALAIKLTSPGPVLFVQERVGRHGRRFRMLKFRTMVVNAEQLLCELQRSNEQAGPVFKVRKDPRITPVGALLRKFSIDELPQLINVLRGDMSLVGPRPPLPAEVSHYEADHVGRLSMRPGLTCLWQVSGRNEIAFEDWVKLDLEYVERWSLLLDFKILLATVPAVLQGRGAS
jgi:exopolysaccharide biosynthesis polyprenyl glycosylphosphotransferase